MIVERPINQSVQVGSRQLEGYRAFQESRLTLGDIQGCKTVFGTPDDQIAVVRKWVIYVRSFVHKYMGPSGCIVFRIKSELLSFMRLFGGIQNLPAICMWNLRGKVHLWGVCRCVAL